MKEITKWSTWTKSSLIRFNPARTTGIKFTVLGTWMTYNIVNYAWKSHEKQLIEGKKYLTINSGALSVSIGVPVTQDEYNYKIIMRITYLTPTWATTKPSVAWGTHTHCPYCTRMRLLPSRRVEEGTLSSSSRSAADLRISGFSHEVSLVFLL